MFGYPQYEEAACTPYIQQNKLKWLKLSLIMCCFFSISPGNVVLESTRMTALETEVLYHQSRLSSTIISPSLPYQFRALHVAGHIVGWKGSSVSTAHLVIWPLPLGELIYVDLQYKYFTTLLMPFLKKDCSASSCKPVTSAFTPSQLSTVLGFYFIWIHKYMEPCHWWRHLLFILSELKTWQSSHLGFSLLFHYKNN